MQDFGDELSMVFDIPFRDNEIRFDEKDVESVTRS